MSKTNSVHSIQLVRLLPVFVDADQETAYWKKPDHWAWSAAFVFIMCVLHACTSRIQLQYIKHLADVKSGSRHAQETSSGSFHCLDGVTFKRWTPPSLRNIDTGLLVFPLMSS